MSAAENRWDRAIARRIAFMFAPSRIDQAGAGGMELSGDLPHLPARRDEGVVFGLVIMNTATHFVIELGSAGHPKSTRPLRAALTAPEFENSAIRGALAGVVPWAMSGLGGRHFRAPLPRDRRQ